VFAPREDRKSAIPLPVSSATFKDIFNALKLPAVFLRVLMSGFPMALRFEQKLGGGSEGAS